MLLASTLIEQCETIRAVQKNKNKLGLLQKQSVFSLNVDSDPINKLRIENTKLLEKVKQVNENLDILSNKLADAQSQLKQLEKLSADKSSRIANMQEEAENLRLNLQK